MQIANRLANFSLGEADYFAAARWARRRRKRCGTAAKFLNGCANNKIPEKEGERIFNLMEEFCGIRI